MRRTASNRMRAAIAVLFAALLALPGCKKPGDGASGVQPPADTRKADQAPQRQP